MDYQFYYEANDAYHNPFELLPCIELDLHQFLAMAYHVRSIILENTYRSEVDGWMMRVKEVDLIIILDTHRIFLEDECKFTKI